jgi:nucleoid-associated protein YgaU
MTDVTQHDPAPAERPGRSFAVLALIVVCLAAAAGGYVFEANRTAPVVGHPEAPPPTAAAQPPHAVPATAKTPPPVQQARAQQPQPPQAQPQQATAQQALAQPSAPKAVAKPVPAPQPAVRLAGMAEPAALGPGASQPAAPQPAAPQPAAPQPATPQPAAPLAAAKPVPPHPAAPSVDVVRIDQYDSLVMAGRAQPGETITIHSGATVLGSVTADADGQWVFLPDATLPSGVHQLSVADAKAAPSDTAAQTTVLLSLPGQHGAGVVASVRGTPLKSGPIVVMTQGNQPPRLLLAPPGSHPGPVGLDIVQYDDQGRIRFTGHGQPGKTVRLYVNNRPLGDAVSDSHGIWTLAPAADLPPGIYQLRSDELAANGRVIARSEVPFARASLTQVLAPGQAVVQPGDCLWTIARHNYGRGVVYTAIFEENRDQIRDPQRIYPGQAFHMPTQDEAAHAPPPSSLAPLIRSEYETPARHGARHVKRPEEGETSRG